MFEQHTEQMEATFWKCLRAYVEKLADLNFVNDLALMAEDSEELKILPDRLYVMASRLGLRIKSAKIKKLASAPKIKINKAKQLKG